MVPEFLITTTAPITQWYPSSTILLPIVPPLYAGVRLGTGGGSNDSLKFFLSFSVNFVFTFLYFSVNFISS